MSAALLSTAVFSAASLARRMICLDVIRSRTDWQGLLLRFQASGSPNLRDFVLTEYRDGLAATLLVSIAVGALCGAIGGTLSIARRSQRSRARA